MANTDESVATSHTPVIARRRFVLVGALVLTIVFW